MRCQVKLGIEIGEIQGFPFIRGVSYVHKFTEDVELRYYNFLFVYTDLRPDFRKIIHGFAIKIMFETEAAFELAADSG